MFRRARSTAPPRSTPAVLPGLHVEAVLVADVDTGAINRERALRQMTGRQMQGVAGSVIDYDRGDPAHSFMGVVAGVPSPARAYARIGRGLDQAQLANGEVYDLATTDAELTAYQQAMLARIAR